MCVTFTSMSMLADIAGVRRSFVPTGCRSAVSAGASRDYSTSNKVLTLSIPPSPLTPPSLPSLTSRFDSFPTLCRWQGMHRWMDPVGTMGIPRVNRCARVFLRVWRKYGRVWRKYGRVWPKYGVWRKSVTCVALFRRAAQRSGVASGSQRSAGGRRHR